MHRHGLKKANGYWYVPSTQNVAPYGEAVKVGNEWEAWSSRDHSITATCDTLEEAAQFLYYG